MKRIDVCGRFALVLALVVTCAVVPVRALAKSADAEEQCAKLAAKAAQDTNKKDRVDQATIVSATWTSASATLPAHCLVLGYVTTGDKRQGFNHVNIEVRLPESWNGKFYVGGNGGFAGSFQANINVPLGRGYATARTDTGHQGSAIDASWAQDSPTKVVDFGYRAVHETAVAGKELVQDFYGKKAKHSYFQGCSRGGGQALMEAQRFPKDFDGIIGGAPAYNWSRFMIGFAWNEVAMYPDRANLSSPVLPLAKLPYVEQQVLANCDAVDGITDGIIDDPRACTFNADSHLAKCAVGDAANPRCLTTAELNVVKAVYQGPSNSQGQIFPGFPVGGESQPGGWNTWIVGASNLFGAYPNLHYAFGGDFFKYLAYPNQDDGSFDIHDFDFETAPPTLDFIGGILNATDPNLDRLERQGGKLILYNGWSDPAITALGTIDYFEQVAAALGQARTDTFMRLYLAPGMLHCGGGPGPNEFDLLIPLEQWVENGIAPGAIVAVHRTGGVIDIERPLCPYPQVARQINPSGSTVQAANFHCVFPQ
jgi:feruloyl esterase